MWRTIKSRVYGFFGGHVGNAVWYSQAVGVNDETSAGRRLILTMQRRLITNKIVLWIIILVLILCIGVVVYFGYIQ